MTNPLIEGDEDQTTTSEDYKSKTTTSREATTSEDCKGKGKTTTLGYYESMSLEYEDQPGDDKGQTTTYKGRARDEYENQAIMSIEGDYEDKATVPIEGNSEDQAIMLIEGDMGDVKESDEKVEYVKEESYTQKTIKFASEYVSEIVIKKFKKAIMNKLRTELNVCLSSNSVLCTIFEEIAHRILLNGGDFKVRSLDDSEEYVLTLHKQDNICKFSTIETITNDQYFRLDNKNFPSIDSIIAPQYLFQMTISMDHPIKLIGLKKVYHKLSNTDEIDFYFVVPAQLYAGFKKQKYTTTDKNDARRMPLWIKNRVKQYALKIDLSSEIYVDNGSSAKKKRKRKLK